MHWMVYACFAIVLWGVCGVFMKLGTNRISARSMVIWVTVGFLFLVPLMWKFTSLSGLGCGRLVLEGFSAGLPGTHFRKQRSGASHCACRARR